MNRLMYFLLMIFILVGCNNDYIEDNSAERSDIYSAVLDDVSTMPFDIDTKAGVTPLFKKIGLVKRGGNAPIDKVYTYLYGKYISPGVLDPNKNSKLQDNWMAASANDVMMLTGAYKVSAFVPSTFMNKTKPDKDGLVIFNCMERFPNTNYDADTNPDICVHDNIPIGKFSTTPLKFKHIYAELVINMTASKSFINANSSTQLQLIRLEAGGLSYSRYYSVVDFKWGKPAKSTYSDGTVLFYHLLDVKDLATKQSIPFFIIPFDLTTDMAVIFTIGTRKCKFTIPKSTLPKIEGNKRYVVNVSFQ